MKRQYQGFITFMLVCIFALMLSITSFANYEGGENNSITDSNEAQTILQEISIMLPQICNMSQLKAESFSLGDKLNAYRIQNSKLISIDYDLYPILVDNQIIAFAQVAYNNEKIMQISCVIDFAPELQKYYNINDKKSFFIVFANEGVYAVNENKNINCIKKLTIPDLSTINSITENLNKLNNLPLNNITVLDNYPIGFSTYSVQYLTLNIPFVDNDSTSCCPNGLCWASCIAAINNYYRGTSYDALDIHSITGCLSVANANDYKTALSDFGMYTYGPYYTNITFSTLQTLIQGNRLAFMRLDNLGGKVGHIIVPYGYYYNPDVSSNKNMYYMDPNYGGCMVTLPSSGLVYISSNGTNYVVDYYISTAW